MPAACAALAGESQPALEPPEVRVELFQRDVRVAAGPADEAPPNALQAKAGLLQVRVPLFGRDELAVLEERRVVAPMASEARPPLHPLCWHATVSQAVPAR
eukprot:2435281-Lingulodinium_polyedra.AAC.1